MNSTDKSNDKKKEKRSFSLFERLLIVAVVAVIAVCTCLFVYMGVHMSSRSTETINVIGELYMTVWATTNKRDS